MHLPILFLTLATMSCSKKSSDTPEPRPTATDEVSSHSKTEANLLPDTNPLSPLSAEEMTNNLSSNQDFTKASDYVVHLADVIKQAQGSQNPDVFTKVLGANTLSQEQQLLLKKLIGSQGLKIDPKNPVKLIGEIKANKHARWAINLEENSPILLDVKRDPSGNWAVDSIILPEKTRAKSSDLANLPGTKTDALNYTHSFLTQLLSQDFARAKTMIDDSNITDAKLAGLCIIFEEAKYKINEKKPLRAIFMRDTAAGFYANVVSNTGEKAAQFSIIAQRDKVGDEWRIYEINLDQLLSNYATRVTAGDTYYTPLLKNPKGGDSLVIYFKFDSEGLSARTQRQLSIVSNILKLDQHKTITIAGHTDAKGGDTYNTQLSSKRAQSVRQYFVQHGVSPEQIILKSYGAKIPRQPNTKNDGSDNPSGRRANRRTEIYLDF